VARGSNTATAAANSAQGLSSGLESNAGNIYSGLAPQLQAEATAPPGFAPTDLAAMNTAAQESAGGATAGATGRGALLAARTKNAGTADAAIADAARSGGENAIRAATGIQGENAQLKEHERQSGLTGLEHLYGEDLGAGIQSAGQVAPDINANTNSENASYDWARTILDPLLAGGATVGAKLIK